MGRKIWGKFDSERLPEIVEEGIPIIRKMGLKVMEMSRGRVSLRVPLAENANHIGIIYAGVLFTLAEVPGGALFLTTFDGSRYVPIVKGMDIRFKKPARTDTSVTVELGQEEIARIEQELAVRGKSDFTLECELTDANGEVVAVARTEYQIRSMG